MKKLMVCLIVIFLSIGAFAEESKKPALSREKKCPVCGMFVSMFPDWNSTIEFADTTRAVTDGPKCMFKYYLDIEKYVPSKSRADVTSVSVKDYNSKTDIDALKALYVVWSDIYGPMGHEPIPFEDEAAAKRFIKEHKGRKILKFGKVSRRVIWSLDNP